MFKCEGSLVAGVPIRQRLDPIDEFVERFAESIIPSAIPTNEFIE